MSYLFITEQDLKDHQANTAELAKRLTVLREELNKHQERRCNAGADDGDESLHHIHTLQEEISLKNASLAEMERASRDSKIIGVPKSAELMLPGTIVTLQRFDEDGHALNKPTRYFVGSYNSTNLKASPPILQYNSPLLIQFVGKRFDPVHIETATVTDGTKKNFIELLRLELPVTKKRTKAVS